MNKDNDQSESIHHDDDSRMMHRQNRKDESFSDEEINRAYEDLLSGLEDLQFHSLNFFLRALQSNKSKDIISRYGNNAIEYIINLSQNGSENIQSLALSCVELFYTYGNFDVSNISQPYYIEFLIQNKLMHSISEANTVLSILSIVAAEEEESITTMLEQNIFAYLADLPPEAGYGELIYIILQQSTEKSPHIQLIISAIPVLLQSPNPSNICNGLKCVNKLISNEWSCFNFDEFHSALPQFLLSNNELIVPTAFEILSNEKFPSNEDDINAVFQCLSNGGENSLFALKFLFKTQEKWIESPPPNIFYGIISCIPTLKYVGVELALQVLIPSLKASGIEFNPDQVRVLSNFLGDRGTARYIVIALNIIWERIQALENHDWFIDEIVKFDSEIDEITSYPDEGVSNAALRLIEIIS